MMYRVIAASKVAREAAARVCGKTEITEGLPRACQTLKQRSAPSVRANCDTGAMLVRAAILSVARLSCQRATQSIR